MIGSYSPSVDSSGVTMSAGKGCAAYATSSILPLSQSRVSQSLRSTISS